MPSMIAAQVQDNAQIELGELPEPALPKGGAVVAMTACGLCGSDLDKLINEKAPPGTVLGHEVVGIIEQLDDNHGTEFRIGDRIVSAHHVPCGTCHYCINHSESMCQTFKHTNLFPGGFAQRFALTQEHLVHTAFKIPTSVTDAEASCIEPLACVLKAVRRGGHFSNGSVAVVGLGFIGLMACQVYQNDGYFVYGLDLADERRELAVANGFVRGAFDPAVDQQKFQQALDAQTEFARPNRVDVVFLTVVTPNTVAIALETVRDSGTIVLFSSALPPRGDAAYSDAGVLYSQLYFREINLIPSYSPALQDLKTASEMIFNQRINVRPLCTHERPLGQLQEAVSLYQQGKAIKVIITP